MAFDVTSFVNESIKEVVLTLLLSIGLVILVIFVFLQHPRSTLIPAATIPVSLIGTFFVMQLFGFTINTITLFGLTLATGLVVDDAIVVIENIARHMQMNIGKQSGVASAAEAMREIQSAVVASSLVLLAVFVPVGFFPGTTGQIYRQFALTIAASITISLFMALTLAPVLSARLLAGEYESKAGSSACLTLGFKRFRDWYGRFLPTMFRRRWPVAGAFLARAADHDLSRPAELPQAFYPMKIWVTSSSSFRRLRGRRRGRADIQKKPKRSFDPARSEAPLRRRRLHFHGLLLPTAASCSPSLRPWGDRKSPCLVSTRLPLLASGCVHVAFLVRLGTAAQLRVLLADSASEIFAFNPPAINGVGTFGGFQFELEDRGNVGLPATDQDAFAIMGAAAKDRRLTNVFTQYSNQFAPVASRISIAIRQSPSASRCKTS